MSLRYGAWHGDQRIDVRNVGLEQSVKTGDDTSAMVNYFLLAQHHAVGTPP
jgi:hypothetical protein